jgi:hypothetical protein
MFLPSINLSIKLLLIDLLINYKLLTKVFSLNYMSSCRQTKNINTAKIYISKLKIVAVFPIRNNLVRSQLVCETFFFWRFTILKTCIPWAYIRTNIHFKKNRMKKID